MEKSRFYVGQKVVAVRDSKDGTVKKGAIYTIGYISECPKCKVLCVDIGIKDECDEMECCYCGCVWEEKIWLKRASYFAPIQTRDISIENSAELIRDLKESLTKTDAVELVTN